MCDRGTGAVRSGAQEVSGSVLPLPSVSASWIAGGAILPSQAPTGVALGQSLLSSPYLLDLLGRSAHTLQSPKYDLEGSCPSPPVRYGAPHKVTCRLPEFIESRGTETGAQRGEVERPGGLTVLAGARKITAIGVAMLRVGPGLPEINDIWSSVRVAHSRAPDQASCDRARSAIQSSRVVQGTPSSTGTPAPGSTTGSMTPTYAS
jgi:hypothetical protein